MESTKVTMRQTHHSEYLKLRSVYLKSARKAFISDIHLSEEWRELNYLSRPDFDAALDEYRVFENFLIDADVGLYFFPQDDKVTIDSIYCRDASIATDFGMIICNMGKDKRKNEPSCQMKVFEDNAIPILGVISSPGTLEGGDVAWLDEKTLAVGHTYRTNKEGIQQLKQFLEPKGISIIVAELPHYRGKNDVFHLMSILSPIDKDLALVYSPLMPIAFRNELLDRGFDLIEVPDEEFDTMGCNVLAIAPRTCVMVEGNPKTKKALENANCKVLTYLGGEISIKGGGGPTCLTRPLLRSY